MNQEQPKLCKDCRHFDNSLYCQHEVCRVLDLVEGKHTQRTCYKAREFDDLCGKEGKLWEAKG